MVTSAMSGKKTEMIHIVLDDGKERSLVFYLAMEEYLARYTEDEAFFVWQVPPTVIIGRNQVMAAEVNLPYCRAHGIRVFRRKSGGGCVYSDRGNLMVSCVVSGKDVPFLFENYIRRLALCLRRAGLEAEVSGRNDILVSGKKVSGNAFFSIHGRNVLHGTLLFDCNPEQLENVLTPSGTKLRSKGVSSVRQRVGSLRQFLAASGQASRHVSGQETRPAFSQETQRASFCRTPYASCSGLQYTSHSGSQSASGTGEQYADDMAAFSRFVVDCFCDSERTLGENEIRKIEEIEKTYLDPVFLYGHEPAFSVSSDILLPLSGTVTISLDIRRGRIAGCSLSGDYLHIEDGLQEDLSRRLASLPPFPHGEPSLPEGSSLSEGSSLPEEPSLSEGTSAHKVPSVHEILSLHKVPLTHKISTLNPEDIGTVLPAEVRSPFTAEDIMTVLSGLHPERYIRGMDCKKLATSIAEMLSGIF